MQGTENFTLNATKTSILTSTNMLGGDATEYFPDEKGNFNLGDTSQVMYMEYKVGSRVFDKAVALKTLKPATVQSDYKFLEGENGSWTQNSDGTLRFRANGEFSKFTEVKVDGILVSADNYTAQSGSTIIIFKSSYLKSLSAGTHKITVVYTDGECSANFEVKQVAEGTTRQTQLQKQTQMQVQRQLRQQLLIQPQRKVRRYLQRQQLRKHQRQGITAIHWFG